MQQNREIPTSNNADEPGAISPLLLLSLSPSPAPVPPPLLPRQLLVLLLLLLPLLIFGLGLESGVVCGVGEPGCLITFREARDLSWTITSKFSGFPRVQTLLTLPLSFSLHGLSWLGMSGWCLHTVPFGVADPGVDRSTSLP